MHRAASRVACAQENRKKKNVAARPGKNVNSRELQRPRNVVRARAIDGSLNAD